MLLLLALTCARHVPEPAVRARELAQEADQRWTRRAEIGLQAAGEPLIEAQKAFPGGPGVAWRLTRWYVALGLAATDPIEAKRRFASGREAAIACLDQSPVFASWH